MSNILVTYHAPTGDSQTCQVGSLTFTSGKPVELEDTAANKLLVGKLKGNKDFEVSEVADKTAPHPAPKA